MEEETDKLARTDAESWHFRNALFEDIRYTINNKMIILYSESLSAVTLSLLANQSQQPRAVEAVCQDRDTPAWPVVRSRGGTSSLSTTR